MTALSFTKMHALGNDFMVVNNLDLNLDKSPATIAAWGDRHRGIGFDQALLIEPSNKADFFCRILNTDGSEAEQCGNGLRCVALYLKTKQLSTKASLSIETRAGVFPIHFCDDGEIEVVMGQPTSPVQSVTLAIANQPLHALTVSLGNPHCILAAPQGNPGLIGQTLNQQHPAFPAGVNVGFMNVLNEHHIRLQTYERGVGFTHACGSNAVAAAVAGITEAILCSPVQVEFRYGTLCITWEGDHHPILMKGPASLVFEGRLIS